MKVNDCLSTLKELDADSRQLITGLPSFLSKVCLFCWHLFSMFSFISVNARSGSLNLDELWTGSTKEMYIVGYYHSPELNADSRQLTSDHKASLLRLLWFASTVASGKAGVPICSLHSCSNQCQLLIILLSPSSTSGHRQVWQPQPGCPIPLTTLATTLLIACSSLAPMSTADSRLWKNVNFEMYATLCER